MKALTSLGVSVCFALLPGTVGPGAAGCDPVVRGPGFSDQSQGDSAAGSIGNRESIEVFELDARPKPPTLTWIGCAVAPDPIGLNSVVGQDRKAIFRCTVANIAVEP